jgi:hypothetical protein
MNSLIFVTCRRLKSCYIYGMNRDLITALKNDRNQIRSQRWMIAGFLIGIVSGGVVSAAILL